MESDDDDGAFEDLPYRVQVAYDATIGTYMCLLLSVRVYDERAAGLYTESNMMTVYELIESEIYLSMKSSIQLPVLLPTFLSNDFQCINLLICLSYISILLSLRLLQLYSLHKYFQHL
jgi:hypothetical protein